MTGIGLRVRDLTVRYGGITAVERVSLEVARDGITGLIGPNGAGKSSLFSACAGTVRAEGSIELLGRDVTHMGPTRRARHGLGRTFQRIQLFRTMSVRENVAMGHEAAYVRRRPWSLFYALPSERRETARVTEEVLDLCDLAGVADRVVGSLSTGEQRMVELARALASPAELLLLDEPSSGLSSAERARFTGILEHATQALNRGVFVVEHDMDLVAKVCQVVHVLNFGRLIFSGSMAGALADEVVRESYLGVTTAGAGEAELEVGRA